MNTTSSCGHTKPVSQAGLEVLDVVDPTVGPALSIVVGVSVVPASPVVVAVVNS